MIETMNWYQAEVSIRKGLFVSRLTWPSDKYIWWKPDKWITDEIADDHTRLLLKRIAVIEFGGISCIGLALSPGIPSKAMVIVNGWLPSLEDREANDWVKVDIHK